MKLTPFALVLVTCAFIVAGAQQPTYKRDIPDSLSRAAKITETTAVAIAQKRLPKETLASAELERENGKLIYSFDFKLAGKTGIDEVNVDAITGRLVGNVEHESPSSEKKEAAADAKTPPIKKS